MTASQNATVTQVFEAARRGDVTVGRNADGNVVSGLITVEVACVTWWISVKPGCAVYIRNANGWATGYRGEIATAAQADAIRLRMTWEFGGRW